MTSTTHHQRATRWVAVTLTAVALGYLGWTWGSATPPGRPATAASAGPTPAETAQIVEPSTNTVPASGEGRDAFTPTETTTARDLALDADLRGDTTDVTGAPGAEVIAVQVAQQQHTDAHRRAAVLLYDYRSDRLIKRLVDLTARRVEQTFTATEMQPPPTSAETTTAATLLWNHDLSTVLRERYQARTGTPMTTLEQVAYKAQTFIADTGSHGPATACGKHRCLMLLPQPAGEQFIDLTDVVIDLSARTVVRLSD